MKIAILDDYQNVVKDLDCFSIIKDLDVIVLNETYKDENTLASKIKDVETLVLIRERTIISDSLLSKLPNLKAISQTGRLNSNIDIDACKKHQVEILEGKGSPIAPSELTWAIIMSSWRNIPEYTSNFKQNLWQNSSNSGLGKVLNSYTIGVWGYGKIGQRISSYAKAFNMNVVVWGSESSRQKAIDDGFEASSSKEQFFSSCDIITLHLKLNDATKYIVKKDDLELMKNGSLFVNTSRAELVEKDALYDVLKRRKNLKAAIDVFEVEPTIPKENKLLNLENVFATPHLGYVEKNNYELYFKLAFENIVEYLKLK